jgi:hypothetical protein
MSSCSGHVFQCQRGDCAYFVLRKFGVSTSANDGEIVRLAEHFDEANSCVEI